MFPGSNRSSKQEADAYVLATRVGSIGWQMACPPLVGYYFDQRWGCSPWLLILGAFIGFTVSMLELISLSDKVSKKKEKLSVDCEKAGCNSIDEGVSTPKNKESQ